MLIKFDKVVVGDSLEALVYAFKHSYPIITKNVDFLPVEYLPANLDYETLPIYQRNYEFPTRNGEILTFGPRKENLWVNIVTLMNLKGLVVAGTRIQEIRVLPEQKNVRIVTEQDFIIKVSYNKLYLFDGETIQGLDHKIIDKVVDSKIKVVDKLRVTDGGTLFSKLCLYEKLEDEFINEIWVHRHATRALKGTTLYVTSYLTKEEMDDVDNSLTIVSILMRDHLRKANKRSPVIYGDKRFVKKHVKYTYEPIPDVEIMSDKLEDLVNLSLEKGMKCLSKLWNQEKESTVAQRMWLESL